MITTQIITLNSQNNLEKTLTSLKGIGPIIVNDLGSTDQTREICQKHGVILRYHQLGDGYASLRNRLTTESSTNWQLYLNPGEVVVQGHQLLKNLKFSAYYVPLISGTIYWKEIRLWNKERNYLFQNSVFESLHCETQYELNLMLYCDGQANIPEKLTLIKAWRDREPTNAMTYYAEASCMLSLGKMDEFMRVSEHYMFLEKNKTGMSAIMNRYYYAMCSMSKGQVKPTLQNLNLCLCVKPLMAEFWCAIGDVYYHLLRQFDKAKEFYENAMLLGSRRKGSDKWPMDISKYKNYPLKMIESCKKLLESKISYADVKA